MAKKTVGVYLSEQIDNEITQRGDNRSHTINRDLERLYTMYRRAIREIPLSVKEACLITDAMNGTLMDGNTAQLLWASIEDAISLEGLAAKWEVDGPALVEKLRGLNAFQCMALCDTAERFWCLKDVSLEDGVRQCFSIREG